MLTCQSGALPTKRKHGEQGATDWSNRCRVLPGKPGPVSSGEVLPKGTTTVKWTATDKAGNTGTAITFVTPDENRRLFFIRKNQGDSLRKGTVPDVDDEEVAIDRVEMASLGLRYSGSA